MGPNALWLMEWLCESVSLQADMRVLDLGCGRAISSVFLAREYGVQVHATDLWIPAHDNWTRVVEAGLEDRVVPIHAEAHALPFAEGYFDAILAVDSYAYFGTDDLYLSYITRFLTPGGRLGIVVPGLVDELDDGPPDHLTSPQANGSVFWEPECSCFHSADWWRQHWQRSGLVEVEVADRLEGSCRHWVQHERAVEASGLGVFPSVAEALETDDDRTLALVRAVARRPENDPARGPHAWEPAFMGVCAELLASRDSDG
jgi:cyclopropane fatty-acyl-phospholipid synthase-like methyltransferase